MHTATSSAPAWRAASTSAFTPVGAAPYSGYPCFNAPPAFAKALSDAGFDLLLTANNHTLDRGATTAYLYAGHCSAACVGSPHIRYEIAQRIDYEYVFFGLVAVWPEFHRLYHVRVRAYHHVNADGFEEISRVLLLLVFPRHKCALRVADVGAGSGLLSLMAAQILPDASIYNMMSSVCSVGAISPRWPFGAR